MKGKILLLAVLLCAGVVVINGQAKLVETVTKN